MENNQEVNEVKAALTALGEQVKNSIAKYEGQLQESGSVATENRDALKQLSADYKAMRDRIAEIEKKGVGAPASLAASGPKSWGEQFIDAKFSAISDPNYRSGHHAVNLTPVRHNNIVGSGTDNVLPMQRTEVIPGDFRPKTIRSIIPVLPVTSNTVETIRERSWTNNAGGQNEGLTATGDAPTVKPQSDITFEPFTVAIRTLAHWLKISKQLLADAPAVAAYIDTRLRDGLADEVDRQIILGTNTATTIAGLVAEADTVIAPLNDSLVDTANQTIWQLWNLGYAADAIVVNPNDWSAVELLREDAGTGMYLYGPPGSVAEPRLFRVPVIPNRHIVAGTMIVAALRQSVFLLDRQAATVTMGYEGNDFTRNLITVLAEERLALSVDRPRGVATGPFVATP